jgi:crotonobetainyl-CoA:carnitine CoA-transferase CaiB-like acyl-CoA transferase
LEERLVPQVERRAAVTAGPLAHVKVLDLTQARAGPTAVRQLADMGADVVQVLRPGAEAGEARVNSDRENLHRNKRSIIVDLQREEGRAVFYRLVPHFDVVVENFRPDVKRRLRIDYETLAALNPRLIYGSISGFGQDGPYGARGGVDQIAQGLGGLMSVTGPPGSGPWRVGIPISDLCAGMFLAQGILVALLERERSGRGQWVHTSLLEAMIAMLDFQATRWLIDGEVPPQAGNDHPTFFPMGVFRTADGYINIAASGGRLWERFLEAIDAGELAVDPRFADPRARNAHREELRAACEERLRRRTSAEWVEALNAVGVPAGPVLRIDQTFADPQVQHLDMTRTVHHPLHGALRVVRSPVNLSRTPPSVRTAAPLAGADTEAVLAEHGFSPDEIAALTAAGVVGRGAPVPAGTAGDPIFG